MKVFELEGPLLDYWAAKADGLDPIMEWYLTATPRPACVWLRGPNGKPFFKAGEYSPSTDWKIGGPIIEREKYEPHWLPRQQEWFVYRIQHETDGFVTHLGYGNTMLIAAMRCFVASKFGEEVPDDEPEKV